MFAMSCMPWRGSGESKQVTSLALEKLMVAMLHVPPLGWQGMPPEQTPGLWPLPTPPPPPTHTPLTTQVLSRIKPHSAGPQISPHNCTGACPAAILLPESLAPPSQMCHSLLSTLGFGTALSSFSLTLFIFPSFLPIHLSCVFIPPCVVPLIHISNLKVISGAKLCLQFGHLTVSCWTTPAPSCPNLHRQ